MNTDRKQCCLPVHKPSGEASDARQERLDALGRLAGGIAHDFNNVLHVIGNAAELLRTKINVQDAEAVRLLAMLKHNAARGSRLTRDLLAFSGRQPLEPAPVNPNRIIANMQDRLRDAIGRRVPVETVLEGSLWQVSADAEELDTAILNLALNARDATTGPGKIVIETANAKIDQVRGAQAGLAPGEYVTITVRDDGQGMTESILANAFEPYFTTKTSGAATGLGLSRVYGFVRQTNGHIRIESALDAGTAVTIYLPRMLPGAPEIPEAELADTKVVSLNAPAARVRHQNLQGLRVLVVEDESLIGMLAEDFLEQLGCRMVGLISSLGKALEAARSAEVDFALLDVDIGGEPVYPVAVALEARGIPFVFMSGYGGLDNAWRSRPIVQKPFELEQLKREMTRALSAAAT